MSGQFEQLFTIHVLPEGSEGVGTQNLGGTGMEKVGEHLERLLTCRWVKVGPGGGQIVS